MRVIIGLGNPEREYKGTRHNMGFDVVNYLAKEYEIEMTRTKFNALYGMGTIDTEKVILVKPQTYMNLSGQAIIEFKNFYKLELADIIVVYDDIDLEPGQIRIRKEGSPGTHNGAKSVSHYLGNEYTRIRVGIGKPEFEEDLINYVIVPITEEEKAELEAGIEKASQAVIEIIQNGLQEAQNKFN